MDSRRLSGGTVADRPAALKKSMQVDRQDHIDLCGRLIPLDDPRNHVNPDVPSLQHNQSVTMADLPAQKTSTSVILTDEPAVYDNSMLQKRAERNYQTALLRLQKAIPKSTSACLSNFKFPEFDGTVSIESEAQRLEDAIEQLIAVIEGKEKSESSITQKVKSTVKKWFLSSYPFAQLFLKLSKDAASVFAEVIVFTDSSCQFSVLMLSSAPV